MKTSQLCFSILTYLKKISKTCELCALYKLTQHCNMKRSTQLRASCLTRSLQHVHGDPLHKSAVNQLRTIAFDESHLFLHFLQLFVSVSVSKYSPTLMSVAFLCPTSFTSIHLHMKSKPNTVILFLFFFLSDSKGNFFSFTVNTVACVLLKISKKKKKKTIIESQERIMHTELPQMSVNKPNRNNIVQYIFFLCIKGKWIQA